MSGASFAYDANGNMTTGLGGKAMTWDAENRVKTARLGGVTTTYVYGADGARLKRTVGGSTTVTVGPIEVRGYGSGSETLLTYPQPEVRLSGGQAAYLHRDQVGSIQLVTDAAGADGEHATYQPFGEARTVVAGTIPAETKGFVGERYDAAPELQYLNARTYDPELSLFVSPDWLEVTDPGVGTNRYAYAGNSPVNLSDPGGNCPSCVGAAIGGLLGAAVEFADDISDGGGWHSAQEYGAAALGGAVGGATFGLAAPVVTGIVSGAVAGAASSGAATAASSLYETGSLPSASETAVSMAVGSLTGGLIGRLSQAATASLGWNAVPGSLSAEIAAPKAWSVGDDIYAITSKGNEPAWSTVRGRFWKNEAANPQYGTWDAQQLDRMGRGLAPQRYNLDKRGIESMDLSHEPIPFRSGGRDVVPRWPGDHAAVDPFRRPGY